MRLCTSPAWVSCSSLGDSNDGARRRRRELPRPRRGRPLVFVFAGADGGRGTFGLRGGGANSKGDGGEGFCYADEGGVGVVGE